MWSMACFCMIYSQNTFSTWFASFVLIFMDNNLVSQIMGWLALCTFKNGLFYLKLLMESVNPSYSDTHTYWYIKNWTAHSFVCLIWFDSLRPIDNLSVIKECVFLGWTSTKLGLMCLPQEHNSVTPVRLEPRPLSLESSTLPLSHCA